MIAPRRPRIDRAAPGDRAGPSIHRAEQCRSQRRFAVTAASGPPTCGAVIARRVDCRSERGGAFYGARRVRVVAQPTDHRCGDPAWRYSLRPSHSWTASAARWPLLRSTNTPPRGINRPQDGANDQDSPASSRPGCRPDYPRPAEARMRGDRCGHWCALSPPDRVAGRTRRAARSPPRLDGVNFGDLGSG